MTIVVFIIILSVLILVHEFGHLLLAKWTGTRVDEFGLGFPPRLWSFRRGGTTYALNLLPFGGYVKIFGEDPTETRPADAAGHFASRPAWAQALILVGGVTFNWLAAWLILVLGFATVGLPTVVDDIEETAPVVGQVLDREVVVLSVLPDSPAARAGLEPEDRIIGLVGEDGQRLLEPSVSQIQNFVAANAGRELILEYERLGERRRSPLTPVLGLHGEKSRATIGVGLAPAGRWLLPLPVAVIEGTKSAFSMTSLTAQGFAELGQRIFGRLTGRDTEPVLDAVAGPVGLAGLVGRANDLGFSYLLLLTALISINLAFLNLLPFPALDGGRLLFLLIEVVRGRPIKPTLANALNATGFALLILLMAIITIADIVKL